MIWIKNQETVKRKLRTSITLISTIVSIYCAIKYSKECSQGVVSGLAFCTTVLVPSLFIFMVIASYISNSFIAEIISRPFSKITEKFLDLPKECASVLILSLIGGYPIGARCVKSLFESKLLSESQAKKLSLIAVSSGPGFVLNYVGSALLNNKKAGVILFLSQIVGFLVVTIIVKMMIKTENSSSAVKKTKNGSFVTAVEKGCKSTIDMCAMVIVFSVILSVLNEIFKPFPHLTNFFTATLEVTTACNILAYKYPLYIISFIIGFGGLCVHAQIFSALKSININKAIFFLLRIIQGITASLTTYILLILFPVSTTVFSSVEKAETATDTSLVGFIALVLTAICFLNSISKTNLKRR